MKNLISESEKNKIRNMYSLNESLLSDVVDKVKNLPNFEEIKKKFKEVTGIDLESKVDITKPQKSDVKVSKSISSSDDDFYEKILDGIGADLTEENKKFLYAWRQAEGGKAAFNPFNTTFKKEKGSFWNCLKRKEKKCVGGVRNYVSEVDGIDATVKTLKNGRYDCVVDGLKNDIGAKRIAEKCKSSLKTWGTGDLIGKVLDGKNLNPPAISKSTIKSVNV